MRPPRILVRPPKRLGAAALALALTAGGVGVVAFLAVPAGAATTNLLTNSGFESGDLTGWSCDAGTGSVVSSPVHSGAHALAGAATSSSPRAFLWALSAVRRKVSAGTPGTSIGYWNERKSPRAARSAGVSAKRSSPSRRASPPVTS